MGQKKGYQSVLAIDSPGKAGLSQPLEWGRDGVCGVTLATNPLPVTTGPSQDAQGNSPFSGTALATA